MSNMKYEQMSKSLRKTNTDFHPYKTMTTEEIIIPIDTDKSASKDEEEKEQVPITQPKDVAEMKAEEDSLAIKHTEEGEGQLKKEDSFPIITELDIPNKQTSTIEAKEPNSSSNVINTIAIHPSNSASSSIDIEPVQMNTIPISSKLIPSTSLINQKYNKERQQQHLDEKLQSLNEQIANYQEERAKITKLKEDYEKLHKSLEREIIDLTFHKAKFEKWREEETKRLQLEKSNSDRDKKLIADLKKENQMLKANENNYKSQIDRLTIQIKELKRGSKETDTSKHQSDTSPNKPKSKQAPYTERNNPINTSKLLKQPASKDISFTSQSQSTPMGSHSTLPAKKKSSPKPTQANTLSSSMDKYDFSFPEEYASKTYDLIKEEKTEDGKVIKWYTNDKKEIFFSSGVRKEIFPDGYQIVHFANGDMKQLFKNGKTVYFFKEARTVQTSFDNGLQVYKFHNGQIEKHYADGKKEIFFVDGSYRIIRADGSEETLFSDGTIQRIDCNHVVTIETANN